MDYIILTNEKNKANKLRELEAQLGLSASDDAAFLDAASQSTLSLAAGGTTTPSRGGVLRTPQQREVDPGPPPFRGFDTTEIDSFKV